MATRTRFAHVVLDHPLEHSRFTKVDVLSSPHCGQYFWAQSLAKPNDDVVAWLAAAYRQSS
ncbi:MAG: hypothetical protein CL483_10125 [Acidobacteria bacterium]|nr:hypothetical protein [Acidobacteriota bacterium]